MHNLLYKEEKKFLTPPVVFVNTLPFPSLCVIYQSMPVGCWWLQNVFDSCNSVVYCFWLNMNHRSLNPWIHYTTPIKKINKACHLGSAMFIWRRFTLTAVLMGKGEGRVMLLMVIYWLRYNILLKVTSLYAFSQQLLKIMFFDQDYSTNKVTKFNSNSTLLELNVLLPSTTRQWTANKKTSSQCTDLTWIHLQD